MRETADRQTTNRQAKTCREKETHAQRERERDRHRNRQRDRRQVDSHTKRTGEGER